ncbi:Hypothetical_protein [Hexamita inflata]|uniref:Hypothetical_protein n=1 Tax=Hexamita inflata TaxID=28002 RepID=A0AA86TLC4_9EUKA|nr:Hypothetical protein HINF_LOCUS6797 [Hexamita inflata]
MENLSQLVLEPACPKTQCALEYPENVTGIIQKECLDVQPNKTVKRVVLLLSSVFGVLSGCGMYFLIQNNDLQYNIVQQLGLSLLIFMFLLSLAGIIYSIRSYCKVKSARYRGSTCCSQDNIA